MAISLLGLPPSWQAGQTGEQQGGAGQTGAAQNLHINMYFRGTDHILFLYLLKIKCISARDLLAEKISSNIANNRIWSGFSDEDSKGHFVDIVTGSKVPDNSMFAVGEPTGDGNCLAIHESRYYIGPCGIPVPSFLCRLRQKPRFQMRGEVRFYLQRII